MKRCPITYEDIPGNLNYSPRGLHLLSPQLSNLLPLAYSAQEQRQEAIVRTGKMSVQGVQAKLSAILNIKAERFDLVDQHGRYILKPQSIDYAELPQNEAITMSLAAMIGITIPMHGLIYCKDNSLTYFIERFDRASHQQKIATEDFSQLLQLDRDTKYNSSMENVAKVITKFCSFPLVENSKLFKLTLFNFLIGNEDMHLKNFSLITHEQKVMLSPAYDLINTSIVLASTEELALPLNGKKRNLTKEDFLKYFALERLNLTKITIEKTIDEIKQALPSWENLISKSFLSLPMQEKYLALLKQRVKRLGL
jgi:serine/threonine-protein kinase HipA